MALQSNATEATQSGSIRRGAAVLVSSEVITTGCGLARHMLVARLISPTDFGIAAALAMFVALFEMLSDLGVGRMLTRLPTPISPSWLDTAHTIGLIRGLLAAAALAACSHLLAGAFNMPQASLTLLCIALVPAVRGAQHAEVWLLQRELSFGRFAIVNAVPQIITLLLAYPVVQLLPDFRAMAVLLILNAALATMISHAVCHRPFRLGGSRDQFKETLSYGLPLILDAGLMFVVMHGDRLVIARHLAPETLGAYSAVLVLLMTPVMVLARVVRSLAVPVLADLDADNTDTAILGTQGAGQAMSALVAAVLAPGIALTVFCSLAGSALPEVIFGRGYSLSALAVGLMGAAFAARLLRIPLNALCLARGGTTLPMQANLVRAIGVVAAWTAALTMFSAEWVLLAAFAAEAGALLTLGFRVRQRYAIPWRLTLVPLAAQLAFPALLFGSGLSPKLTALPADIRFVLALTISGACAGIAVLVHTPSRRLLEGVFAAIGTKSFATGLISRMPGTDRERQTEEVSRK